MHYVFHFIWIRTEHIWFIVIGYIKHESVNDRRFQQSCKQFISARWWLKVTICLRLTIVCPILPIRSALLMWLSFLCNAAYHSPSMTYPNPCNRLTYLTLSHLHWYGRTQALYSCCHHLNRCVARRPTWSMIEPRMMLGPLSIQTKISQVKCPKECGAWLPR